MNLQDNLTCTLWRSIERRTLPHGNFECIGLHLMDRTFRTFLQDNLGCIPFHLISMSCCTLPLYNSAGICLHHILNCTSLLCSFDRTVLHLTSMQCCILPRCNPGRTSRKHYWQCRLPRGNTGCTPLQMRYIPNGTVPPSSRYCIYLGWYILHHYRIGYHKLLMIQRQIWLLIKGRMLQNFPYSLKATGSLRTLWSLLLKTTCLW